MLEQRGQPYVLAVRSTHTLRLVEDGHFTQTDPSTLVENVDAEAWQALAAGEGAKGPRLPLGKQAKEGCSKWLLARRSRHDPAAIAYYSAYAPTNTTLADLAAAAGLRERTKPLTRQWRLWLVF